MDLTKDTPDQPALNAGDRVAIRIAPDVVGVIAEVLEGGQVMFLADGQDTAYEFNQGSFVPAAGG